MYQEFEESKNVHVNRDDNKVVRELLHIEEPFISQARTAQLAAAEYLKEYGELLGIKSGEMNNMSLSHEKNMIDAGSELRFHSEKRLFDMTTIPYQQTHFGLPVWHGGVSIHMKHEPFRVISSQSTRHVDLDVKKPSVAALDRLSKVNKKILAEQIGLFSGQTDFDQNTLEIEQVRLIVYRYVEARRMLKATPPSESEAYHYPSPELPLPPVAKNIQERIHYVAAEVHFGLAPQGQNAWHWIAIIEAETLSVLYVRAFIDNVNGMVFQEDPETDNGGPPPSANNAALNPVRTSVQLLGLAAPAGGPQELTGNNVRIADMELPSPLPAPTEPVGTDFNFNARTNDFAAVNAYYHCDRFFRFMESLGFNLASYFGSATSFPNPVDHRGLGTTAHPQGNTINAHCLGTSGGSGILQTAFALADIGNVNDPLGIACDFRVVLHELAGHGVLYPHVNSPNFGFSHSAGDSVAAIMCE